MSSFILKIIALITMTIDHIGVFIFPNLYFLRIIGRLSFILYAFLITEGFIYSSNRMNYLRRLALMAVIIQSAVLLPHVYFRGNIYFTLAIGLYSLFLLEKKQYLYYTLVLFLSNFLNIDYGTYGVILISFFYIVKEYKINKILQLLIFSLINFYGIEILGFAPITYFSTISLVLIWSYNNEKGYNNKLVNVLFYWYYPLHIIVLNIIKYIIQ